MSTDLAETHGGQVVVCSLAGDEYALPITGVREIIRYAKPRSISSRFAWVRGVINLRGRTVPVCDLAARLGATHQDNADSRIMIVESSTDVAGVIVDAVSEVTTFDEGQVDPLPAGSPDFFQAVAKLDDRLIVVLDPEYMLAGIAAETSGREDDTPAPPLPAAA